MSNITGTIRARATLQEAGQPTVYNVWVEIANTEVAHPLTEFTKSFLIRVRGHSGLKLAYQPGESGSNYLTIRPGVSYKVEGLNFSGVLYFQTTKPNQTIEIVEWV